MCAVGDIIRIDSYISEDGVDMSRHSFIVIDDESSTISGYSYDFISNEMKDTHFKRCVLYLDFLENYEEYKEKSNQQFLEN